MGCVHDVHTLYCVRDYFTNNYCWLVVLSRNFCRYFDQAWHKNWHTQNTHRKTRFSKQTNNCICCDLLTVCYNKVCIRLPWTNVSQHKMYRMCNSSFFVKATNRFVKVQLSFKHNCVITLHSSVFDWHYNHLSINSCMSNQLLGYIINTSFNTANVITIR